MAGPFMSRIYKQGPDVSIRQSADRKSDDSSSLLGHPPQSQAGEMRDVITLRDERCIGKPILAHKHAYAMKRGDIGCRGGAQSHIECNLKFDLRPRPLRAVAHAANCHAAVH